MSQPDTYILWTTGGPDDPSADRLTLLVNFTGELRRRFGKP